MNSKSRGLVWAFGVPGTVYLLALTVAASWATRLPDPMAAQWNSSGLSSTMPLAGYYLYLAFSGLIPLAVLGPLALNARVSKGRRICASIGSAFSVFVCGALLILAAIQLDATVANEVAEPRIVWFGALAAVSAAAGAITAIAIGPAPAPGERDNPPHRAPARALHLGPSENAAYLTSVTNRPLTLTLSITGVLMLGLGLGFGRIVVIVVAAALLATVPLATWRIVITDDAVRASSLVRLPSVRIPLTDIREATATDVASIAGFGGFGLRTRRDGTTGIIVNRGDALELALCDNRTAVLTMPHPDAAADLVNGLIARRGRN